MSRSSRAAVLGLLLVACQKESSSSQNDVPSVVRSGIDHDEQVPAAPPCAATNEKGRFVPVEESGGNTLALMRWNQDTGNTTVAIAADEDAQALHIVDVNSRQPLGMTKLAGKPSRVLAMGDGRIVVSLGDVSALEVLEPDAKTGFPLKRRCLVNTPADPMGLGLTPDQKTLLVATRWEPTLSVFDAADLKLRHTLDLPRDPTNVLASTDGKRAFVTHAAGGMMSVVELEGHPVIPGAPVARTNPLVTSQIQNQSFGMMMPPPMTKIPHKTRRRPTVIHERIGSQSFVLARGEKGIFAPLVMLEPKPPRGSSSGYGSASAEAPAIVGEIATVDEKTGDVHIKKAAVSTGPRDCFLPRAAAIDEPRKEIWVSCLGIDAVVVYDASKKNPHDYQKRRIPVPAGPTGLAIDPESRQAVIFSSFAGEMSFVTLQTAAVKTETLLAQRGKHTKKKKSKTESPEVVRIALPGRNGLPAEIALGRELFHAAGKRKVALDGRACASCHPDGRDDGLTWQTQEGPRQTPMLLGRLTNDTAPFGWLGDKKTLPSHFKRTIERLEGTGLKDSERDAIFAYINSLSPPKSHRNGDDAGIARGKAIFESTETGCSSCHLGDATTDGVRHDVKSAQEFEVARHFETPSLRFIARSAPYFHDGRYKTLLDMFEGCDGTMGTTKHLAQADKASLAAYLETL